MKSAKHTNMKFMLVAALGMAISACNQMTNERDPDLVADGLVEIIEQDSSTSQKATVQEASSEVLALYTFHNEGQVFVEICHRPPGKPKKSKSLTLPLKATLAHLSHGGPHHETKDTLGPCDDGSSTGNDDGSSSDDDTIADDDSSTGGDSTTDGSTTDDGTTVGDDSSTGGDSSDDGSTSGDTTEDIPVWCAENITLDSDCDGLVDETGEPLY